jgi:molecular chaperone IbpA
MTLFPKDFDKFFVGFDDQFSRLTKMHDDLTKNVPNYPFYDIVKTDENKYEIRLAVAGFGQQDIEVELADNKLIVKGKVGSDDADSMENFLFKGISNRAFTRTFALNDQVEVKDAEMLNGMLKIFLERIIPEHKKPRTVEVKAAGTTPKTTKKAKSQLLTEEQKDAISETL